MTPAELSQRLESFRREHWIHWTSKEHQLVMDCVRALLAAPQAAGEWVRRQDAYGALVESAAELIRLRTEGEPLKAADSERLDSLICGLAVRMRARADTLLAAPTQAAQRQTLESMAAQSALEQDPELSDKAQAAQEPRTDEALMVFAKEVILGAYKPEELPDRARAAVMRHARERYVAKHGPWAQEPRRPMTEDEIEEAYRRVYRSLPDNFGHSAIDWIEAGIRYAERIHGIGITGEPTP